MILDITNNMPRRITPGAGQTAHITIRCNNKEFLFKLSQNFGSMVSWLDTLPLFFSIRIHHAILMSNHIHILLTTTEGNIGRAMSYCLTNLSKYFHYKNDTINHIFGNRYSPTIIESNNHLINVIRYIYQNPVRAGITNNVFDYPYSTLSNYLGNANNGFIVSPDSYTFEKFKRGLEGRDEWIEHIANIYNEKDLELVKLSLSRSKFRFTHRQHLTIENNETSLLL